MWILRFFAYSNSSEDRLSLLESQDASLQFLQYRHNIWLCWSKFNATFQHPHNFSRFSLNLSGGMLTGQRQMISGNRVFPFHVFFSYRKHILYQKCAFPAFSFFSIAVYIYQYGWTIVSSSIFRYLYPQSSNNVVYFRLISFKIRI